LNQLLPAELENFDPTFFLPLFHYVG